MIPSRLRPALFSIGVHAAVLAIVVLLGIGNDASGPGRQTVIYAEFLQYDERSPFANESPSEPANEEPADPREDEDPPQPPEPKTAAVRTEQAPSEVEQAARDPSAEESIPAPVEPPESSDEPIAAPTDAPERPLSIEQPIVTPTDEPAPQQPLLVEEASADPVPLTPRGTPIPARQRSMLSTKFASWTGRIEAEQDEANAVWKHDGQEYTATFRQLPADDNMSMQHLLVEVSTEENGRRISTEMRLKRLAFSSFAQFVDHWDPEVRIHDDEVDGRFHSNSEIHLLSNREAKPVFHGRVTTASRGVNTDATGRVDRDRMFLGGLEIGVRTIMLPKRFVPFPAGAGVDEDRTHAFAEDTRITFYPNGTYGWTAVGSGAPEQQRPIVGDAYYLLAADDKKLHVKGVVKGNVLLYSPERIIIEDDLIYAHGPRDARASNGADTGDDYLGIVSDKSVEIAGPDSTGPGDLQIHASIYAKRQFVVRNFRSAESGTLFIYGSLIAGSVSATEPRYATKIQFDRRLENMRAPSFPLTDRYELEAWDGEWRVEDNTSN